MILLCKLLSPVAGFWEPGAGGSKAGGGISKAGAGGGISKAGAGGGIL
jgi:hypothetical protein